MIRRELRTGQKGLVMVRVEWRVLVLWGLGMVRVEGGHGQGGGCLC